MSHSHVVLHKKFLVFILLLASPLLAQGNKPKTEPPKKESSVKDDANQALDDMEHGIKRAAPKIKKAANEALNAIDQGVHKVVDSTDKEKK